MNPPDGHWNELTITVTTQPDGTVAGVMSVGGVTWHLRDWRRAASGVLRGQISSPSDPEWEALLDRLGSKVGG